MRTNFKMLIALVSIFVLSSLFPREMQASIETSEKFIVGRKGSVSVLWGWNRGYYSRSDITFSGKGYNFTLHEVKAKDRQTKFGLDPYFNPGRITIPQTNLQIGYFITDHYELSFGIDHMKYVMTNGQNVAIDGDIAIGGVFDKSYKDEDILLSKDFIKFEHTDGLNYINLEIARYDLLSSLAGGNIEWSVLYGGGLGFLLPKTNATILGKKRHDDFHLSGWGLGIKSGLQLRLWQYFLLRSHIKGGYINMPAIRTTDSDKDQAKQDFFFCEANIMFGGSFQF